MKTPIILKGFLVPAMIILLFSCRYSEYLTIDYTVHHGAYWNNSRSKIVFIASTLAYRNPVGISSFPDGGIPKYLKEDVSAYFYEPSAQKLTKIISFNDLTELIGPYRSNWKTQTFLRDSLFYFHIEPVGGWALYKKDEEKTRSVNNLEKKYNRYYTAFLHSDKIQPIDSSQFNLLYKQFSNSNKASLTDVNRKLDSLPLKEWGFVVQEIYPKSGKEYIEETIYLKNDCQLTRRAVVEQIISRLSDEQISRLISKMEQYENQLEGLKKTEYEINSEKTYQMLRELLEK